MYYKRRRGQYFEIDALVAIGLLIVGLIYVKNLSIDQSGIDQTQGYGEEAIKLLRTLRMGDLKDTYSFFGFDPNPINYYIDDNNSVAKQIGIFYFLGNATLAENLSRGVLDDLIPENYGYSLWIGSRNESEASGYQLSEIYSDGRFGEEFDIRENDLRVSKTLITGLQQTEPIFGKLARLFLGNSRTNLKEYQFFGGFVGQGNLSFIIDLPPDLEEVREVYFEGFTGDAFHVFVKSNYCGTINRTQGNGISNITIATLPGCNQQFGTGSNSIELISNGTNIAEKYIGGGYFKVEYSADTVGPELQLSTTKKYFPGVKGLINIFDSIFMDGNVTNITAFLKFQKDDTNLFVFNYGNETLFETKETGSYSVWFGENNISLDIRKWSSNNNIPIRIGPPAAGEGNADVVWITDRSDSMSNCASRTKDYMDEVSCGYNDDFRDGLGDEWDGNLGYVAESNFEACINLVAGELSNLTRNMSNWTNDFVFELDFNFIGRSLEQTVNGYQEPLNILINDDLFFYRFSINDRIESYNFSRAGSTISTGSIADFNDESKMRLVYSGGVMEGYVNQTQLFSESVALNQIYSISVISIGVSNICLDNFKLYDPLNTDTSDQGYLNYIPGINPGFLYENILPEQIVDPNSEQAVGTCDRTNGVCYSEDNEWVSEVICETGDPKWDVCCNTGSCCDDAHLITFGATDCRTDIWGLKDLTGNPECTQSNWQNQESDGVPSVCRTRGTDTPYQLGDCTGATIYDCAFGYGASNRCQTENEIGQPGLQGDLCEESVLSLSTFGDQGISELVYNTSCAPIVDPSEFPSPVILACGTGGVYDPCFDSTYDKCEIKHTQVGPVGIDCNGPLIGERCKCLGPEECYEYNSVYDRFRTYYIDATSYEEFYFLGYDYLEASGASLQWDYGRYECKNQFNALPNSSIGVIYNYPVSYPLYNGLDYSAGFYKTSFNVDDAASVVDAFINLTRQKETTICYLNNKSIVFHEETLWNVKRIYEIDPVDLEDGENFFGCSFKKHEASNAYFRADIHIDGVEVVSARTGSSNDWFYQNATDYCGRGDQFTNASCEIGTWVNSCKDYYPWTLGQKYSVSSLVNSPGASYSTHYNPMLTFFSDMLGEYIQEEIQDASIPSGFFDTADIFIVDNNGDTGWEFIYGNDIENAANDGKTIILNQDMYDYVTGLAGDNSVKFSSYGFTSSYNPIGNGSIIGVQGSGDSLLDYIDNYQDALTDSEMQEIAGHLYSIIYPIWNSSSSASLQCKSSQYCIPTHEEYCDNCEFYRMDLAKQLDSEFTEDILEVSGNQISLIGYGTNLSCDPQLYGLSENFSLINSTIDQYIANCGATCVSCSLAKAMNILNYAPNMSLGLQTGIQAYWSMNTDGGATLIDNTTVHDGTISGATYTDYGRYESGYLFDGVDDNILVSDGFNDLTDSNDYSASFWIRIRDASSSGTIYFAGRNTGLASHTSVYYNNGVVYFNRKNNAVLGEDLVSGSIGINEWVNVVTVQNSTDLALYLDGVLADTASRTISISTQDELYIGREEPAGEYFNGSLDEGIIWDRELSRGEVKELYELGIANEREKFIMLMSDGDANYAWNEYTETSYFDLADAPNQAIVYAQEACKYNMTLFTVAFGSFEGSETLKQMAQANNNSGCNGLYFGATDEEGLTTIFETISSIINFNLQSINDTEGSISGVLHNTSYIEYTSAKEVIPIDNESVRFTSSTSRFDSCTPSISMLGFKEVTEARVTSYSGSFWTSNVILNGNVNLFNISSFGADYKKIGDPFTIGIPTEELIIANRSYIFDIQYGQTINQGADICSDYNQMVYTAYLPRSYTIYSEILSEAEGCIWRVQFEGDTGSTDIPIPSDYEGSRLCIFDMTSCEQSFECNINNAIDVTAFELFSILDVDNDNLIDINFDPDDLSVDSQIIDEIPYLWGPAILEVRVWK